MTTAAFSASELRYRRLFETAHEGILLVDPATRRIIDVNPFMIEFLGYSRLEFIGRELFEIGLLHDEAASRAAFLELQTRGYIRYDDLPLQARDGRCVEVEFISNRYREGDAWIIQCNVRDITARKQAEAALAEADLKLIRHADELEATVSRRTAELNVSNAQLQTFVYSIAHDLRAPVRAMQGFAQLLVQDHSARLDEEGREYANYINEAAVTMNQLLEDLLSFSRLSQQDMALVPVSLEEAVRSAISACQPAPGAQPAQIRQVAPWPPVLAHAATLRQVLVNLIGNAVKFVADRVPEVTLRSEQRSRQVIRVWVEDNGIGIAPEFQERIFQVFERLHTTAYAGTGIGLAIVQKGMERMGGRAGVVSLPGQGSRFWIELSRAPLLELTA